MNNNLTKFVITFTVVMILIGPSSVISLLDAAINERETLDGEVLDQQQMEWDYGQNPNQYQMYAQSFKPTVDLLSRVELSLHTHPPDWFEFDFPDIDVTPEQTYYIIWNPHGLDNDGNPVVQIRHSLLGDNLTSTPIMISEKAWSIKPQDIYERGNAWIYQNQPPNPPFWQSWENSDFAFKTYGYYRIPTVTIEYPTEGEEISGIIMIYGVASDPNGNETLEKVEVQIDANNWELANGTTNWSYSWNASEVTDGAHCIYARSFDGEHYSQIVMVNVIVNNGQNQQPNIPIITGETNGMFGEEYEYTFVSTDPEDHDVWYYIEWGDGEVEEWIGPYISGEEVVRSHTWDERGEYIMRAKAKDIFGAESDWGHLEVEMPVNQQEKNYPLFYWILERFPNAFPMLRYLLGL